MQPISLSVFVQQLLECDYCDYMQACNITSCLLWLVGGTRVLHPRALLSDVHVCWRVGHTWPKYPAALLPSVEVRSHNRCPTSFCWSGASMSQTSLLFSGFFIGQLMGQRSCMILSAWWTLTFLITARRSPGVSWVFICSLSSIISTGQYELTIF